jgi:predicted kinase
VLVVFGGLPGTGKTSVARRVADALGATFVRIDSIELASSRPIAGCRCASRGRC